MYKYVVTNDWHIGSSVCQRDKLISFLKNLKTEVLILNGDIIDVNHTKRLKKKDWEIFTILRKMSKNTRIIYITGNHDTNISETISELLGFEHMTEFTFEVGNKKVCVTHGDRFDFFVSKLWLLTEIATGIYYFIQKFSSKKQILARAIKRHSKHFVKCCENLKKGALNYAKIKGFDTIICGHSHYQEFLPDKSYINTGCFSDFECSYLGIDMNNNFKLVSF